MRSAAPSPGRTGKMRRVSSAKEASAPGAGRISGVMRASTGSPPSRSNTMVSAPVGSIISTGALMRIGAPDAPQNPRLPSAMHSGLIPSTTSLPRKAAAASYPWRRRRISSGRPAPITTTGPPSSPSSRAGIVFMGGEPMKRATNRLAG